MPLLEETTTVDAQQQFEDAEVAVLPTGSTEQHGPALPLCTDFLAAETVARGVADREDTIVLPTVPIGVSPHHRHFHGTLWVSEETFESYVTDTLESLPDHGIQKAVIVNGHGGNTGSIQRVAQDLYREETAFTVPWSWWEGVGDTPAEVLGEEAHVPGHAGAFEAAMMLYAAAELVREDRFEEAATGQGDGNRWPEPAPRGFDFIDWTDNGIKGDPRLASADAGEALFEAARGSLAELIDWLVEEPYTNLTPREHK